MNKLKKIKYRQERRNKINHVKSLLQSEDSNNNILGLILARTQLKWSAERIVKVVMEPAYVFGRRVIEFSEIVVATSHYFNFGQTDKRIIKIADFDDSLVNYQIECKEYLINYINTLIDDNNNL